MGIWTKPSGSKEQLYLQGITWSHTMQFQWLVFTLSVFVHALIAAGQRDDTGLANIPSTARILTTTSDSCSVMPSNRLPDFQTKCNIDEDCIAFLDGCCGCGKAVAISCDNMFFFQEEMKPLCPESCAESDECNGAGSNAPAKCDSEQCIIDGNTHLTCPGSVQEDRNSGAARPPVTSGTMLIALAALWANMCTALRSSFGS